VVLVVDVDVVLAVRRHLERLLVPALGYQLLLDHVELWALFGLFAEAATTLTATAPVVEATTATTKSIAASP
jgi:hypothetical protein